jgi:hypothetical protein
MSKKMTGFVVREKDLAKALEITPERLDEIIAFFDSDPNDEWELRENDHFVFLTERWQERLFSYHGAFAIAKYMDAIEKKTLWTRIVEFVTRHKAKIRNAFICQKVVENCSSLTTRNNRHFLSKKDVVNILCTSYGRLNKAFDEIQRSDHPMALFEDFDEIEGERYYALSGVDKFCRVLAAGLKDKDRQEWCAAVEVVGKKTVNELISAEEAQTKRIQAAKAQARKRDQSRCQITGQKATKHHKFNIAVHHIFSKEHHPHLAMSLDNLITLKEEVHQEFHAWNGGTTKACTLDDLVRFINDFYSDEERYPEREKLLIKLNQIKQVLKP